MQPTSRTRSDAASLRGHDPRALLRETRFCEASLLLHLDAKQLNGILAKRRLKRAGSKRDRIARLLADVPARSASGLPRRG